MHFRPLHDRVVVRRPLRPPRVSGNIVATEIALTRAPDGRPIAAHCTGALAAPPPDGKRHSRPRPRRRPGAHPFRLRSAPR